MREETIRVTAGHIALGEAMDSELDPLAIAIREALPRSVQDGECLLRVLVEPWGDAGEEGNEGSEFRVVQWDPAASRAAGRWGASGSLLLSGGEYAILSGTDAGRHRAWDETGKMDPFEITLQWEPVPAPHEESADDGT